VQLVLLIRHGLAEYKPGRLYGWTPGVHLSADGREQAKRLAERLEPVKLDALYSSPLERCCETADAILAGRKLTLEIVEGLGEVKYGSWQGKTFRSLVKQPLWRTVQLTPSQATFPGGESLLAMQSRGVLAVEAIRAKHKKGTIAIVTHADMIKALVAHYLGLHLDLFQRIHVETASLSAVAFTGGFPRLVRLSDTGEYTSLAPPVPAPAKPKPKPKKTSAS
jgi:probable phosphomutase (TIGR03848 family)